MSKVEMSPGGIGFVRNSAVKIIPGAPATEAPRHSWAVRLRAPGTGKIVANKRGKSKRRRTIHPDTI